MPWGNQGGGNGGGPWGPPGGGNQNPWGGRGGGATPPDFEAMLRRGQDRFKRAMPGGLGSGRGLIVVLVVVALVWLASGFFVVQSGQVGIIQRFGAYSRTVQEGWNFHLPYPIESATSVSTTAQYRIDIGFETGPDGRSPPRDKPEESLMLTGDENIIDIDVTVLWRVQDAVAYTFNIRDPEVTLKIVAESVLREIIGRTEIQPALTDARDSIEQQVRDLMQTTLDSYGAGVMVDAVQLQNVSAPAEVVDAFNEVLRARSDRERIRNEAETYRNDVIPRARGQAEAMIQQASGYKDQVIAEAQGEAARFTSVLAAYRISPDVTAERLYIETMEAVLAGSNKVIIDQNGGQGVVPYLPLDTLTGRTAPVTAPAAGAAPAATAAPAR